jgi:hypothetical protein
MVENQTKGRLVALPRAQNGSIAELAEQDSDD